MKKWKKKTIKTLLEISVQIDTMATMNRELVNPEVDHERRAVYRSGVISMNASAQSAIHAVINELRGKRKYGGFVEFNDTLSAK